MGFVLGRITEYSWTFWAKTLQTFEYGSLVETRDKWGTSLSAVREQIDKIREWKDDLL